MPLPSPAATVIVLRGDGQFEVLMVERSSRGFFASLVVFPGGKVDDVDVPAGLTLDDDRSHRRAAIRELAEETGILLTSSGPMMAPELKGAALSAWMARNAVTAATDSLVLVSRWVTPEQAPRRFDTRFYLTVCADEPEVRIDVDELVGHAWVTPAEALARHASGVWSIILPTLAHLRWLERRVSVDDALHSARGADGRTLLRPQILGDGSILPIHIPADV